MISTCFFSLPIQITMLINNAGVVSGRALLDTPDELIERSFNVNVLAHFWVIICYTKFNTIPSGKNYERICQFAIFVVVAVVAMFNL